MLLDKNGGRKKHGIVGYTNEVKMIAQDKIKKAIKRTEKRIYDLTNAYKNFPEHDSEDDPHYHFLCGELNGLKIALAELEED